MRKVHQNFVSTDTENMCLMTVCSVRSVAQIRWLRGQFITGTHAVVRSVQKSIGKSKIRPLYNYDILKFQFLTSQTWLRRDDISCANLVANRFSEGLSPSTWNKTSLWHLVTFLTVLVNFFSGTRPGWTPDRFLRCMARTTCFRARRVLFGVRTMRDVIWENTPKVNMNRQF